MSGTTKGRRPKQDPLDVLSAQQQQQQEQEESQESTADKKNDTVLLKKDGTPRKSKAGRPVEKALGEWHTTNIDLLMESYKFFMRNKLAMGGTLSNYINKLILADLEVNKEKYEQITKMIG